MFCLYIVLTVLMLLYMYVLTFNAIDISKVVILRLDTTFQISILHNFNFICVCSLCYV